MGYIVSLERIWEWEGCFENINYLIFFSTFVNFKTVMKVGLNFYRIILITGSRIVDYRNTELL